MSNADQATIQELSYQLIACIEQVKACDRQIQLCQNQEAKTKLVSEELNKVPAERRMYRSMGRMFVLCPKEELQGDLKSDLERIESEKKRSTELKTVLDGKKDKLTTMLQILTPTKK